MTKRFSRMITVGDRQVEFFLLAVLSRDGLQPARAVLGAESIPILKYKEGSGLVNR